MTRHHVAKRLAHEPPPTTECYRVASCPDNPSTLDSKALVQIVAQNTRTQSTKYTRTGMTPRNASAASTRRDGGSPSFHPRAAVRFAYSTYLTTVRRPKRRLTPAAQRTLSAQRLPPRESLERNPSTATGVGATCWAAGEIEARRHTQPCSDLPEAGSAGGKEPAQQTTCVQRRDPCLPDLGALPRRSKTPANSREIDAFS
jgi:hypothetical protein